MTDPNLTTAKRLARRYKVPGWDRDDVQQQVYLWLLEGNTPDQAKDKLRNLIRSELAKLRHQQPDLIGDDDDGIEQRHSNSQIDELDPGPEQNAMSSELLDKLRRILKPSEFKVIELAFWYDCSNAEIAEQLGVTIQTVEGYKSKALKKIPTQFLKSD